MISCAITDEAGHFTLTRVQPGSHRIEAMAPGGQLLTRETTLVREGETIDDVDLVLEN